MEVNINNNSTITILHDNTWKEVQRNIDKKIARFNDEHLQDECSVCFEHTNEAVSCNKCSNDICTECYIKLFKSGEGIITCPHCRFETGSKIPKNMIDLCVEKIKEKLY